VWGEFRRARAFRRSEAEAVSSVQKMFEQSCIIPQNSKSHFLRNKIEHMMTVLHNIRSVYNVGSVFRTADAAGIEKIYLCGITPSPTDKYGRARQDFAKVSLGAEKSVEWEQVKSAARLIGNLKKQGRKIFAVEQDKNSIPYDKFKIGKKELKNAVFVFGNEVDGLPKGILKKSDKILEIPMRGKKESLNVSVAFGIITFHSNGS
jgi:tRNA G18 (ribose-2'-O)-methylase SpoU